MVTRIGTFRRKTRKKMTKKSSMKGEFSLRSYLQEFDAGDRVALRLEPSIHKGMFFPRFHGKIGSIICKNGSCYEVAIKDINKNKTVIVHPVHLKKV